MTTWRKKWADADAKSRALAVASALAAAFLVVAGCALLASWSPLVEPLVLWGAPAWIAPLVGGGLLGLAFLLVVDDVAFYAALAATLFAGTAAFAWARDGNLVLALMPALVCALAAVVMALRSDVAKVHVERVTRRRTLAHG